MIKTKNIKTHVMSEIGHNYNGKYSSHQTTGNTFNGTKYGRVLNDGFSEYQNFLYNRALFGLSVYEQDEIQSMRWDKKQRIMKVHKRAQESINLWKQELINKVSTDFLLSIFNIKNSIIQCIANTSNDTDVNYKVKMSFKDLKIKKTDVVEKLVSIGVLPPNFYEMTNAI